MKKILLIEDDHNIVQLLEIHLKDIHCETNWASTGFEGLQYAARKPYDLIILDIMLPDIDGIQVCQQLRTEKVTTPVMMLTARSEEIDKILGLEIGADDYLTKPFSVREFIARVKAIMRRTAISSEQGTLFGKVISCGDITLDPQKRKVVINGTKVELTPKEFDLLFLFAANPGRSYSREALLSRIWGHEFSGYEHTVNSHINRLRTKIEADPAHPRYILTTWGVGYRFTDEMQ